MKNAQFTIKKLIICFALILFYLEGSFSLQVQKQDNSLNSSTDNTNQSTPSIQSNGSKQNEDDEASWTKMKIQIDDYAAKIFKEEKRKIRKIKEQLEQQSKSIIDKVKVQTNYDDKAVDLIKQIISAKISVKSALVNLNAIGRMNEMQRTFEEVLKKTLEGISSLEPETSSSDSSDSSSSQEDNGVNNSTLEVSTSFNNLRHKKDKTSQQGQNGRDSTQAGVNYGPQSNDQRSLNSVVSNLSQIIEQKANSRSTIMALVKTSEKIISTVQKNLSDNQIATSNDSTNSINSLIDQIEQKLQLEAVHFLNYAQNALQQAQQDIDNDINGPADSSSTSDSATDSSSSS